ncbi:bifunctional precorrin-2 dehydrogenase/sirohydrochlorin ferrochelatase [Paenibacillus filicis]|uniref:precorrin-2 dehydrogenase n=1 Tax=Paenibacillus gyeongsangnamensis TaxID=3388067 RepID=A0ABT4Q8X2_9BACL|nr:bifunctional precorrin-2 dehydrogenase/sirohydrochlorin ferrochelatase [Paenibacillus filicis]MCZ8513326.1 bifunctional precorrin-2 dehydrogenase/sirohydrochlorin ferrochelatase [Paenibacillus filicis]
MPKPERTTYYPVMLDLKGKPCIVIGGGAVAERKTASLLEAEAEVTVVSPECTEQLNAWADAGVIRCHKAEYSEGLPELADAVLIFAATDRSDVNERVRREAAALGKLVNAADDGGEGGFILPAVVRRGRLTLAVSTGGASPGLASRLRSQLEETFDDAYEPYLDLLYRLRTMLQSQVALPRERQQMMRAALAWDLLGPMRDGRWPAERSEELLAHIRRQPTMQGMMEAEDWIRQVLRQNGQ